MRDLRGIASASSAGPKGREKYPERPTLLLITEAPGERQSFAHRLEEGGFDVFVSDPQPDPKIDSGGLHLVLVETSGEDGPGVERLLEDWAVAPEVPVVGLVEGAAEVSRTDRVEVSMDRTWSEENLFPMFLQGIVREAGERRRANELEDNCDRTLRMEESFCNAILDTSAALIVVLGEDGRIELFNRACEELTGHRAGEVHGKFFGEIFFSPEERARCQQLFARLWSGEMEGCECESLMQRADGHDAVIRWRTSVLRRSGGEVRNVVASGMDLSGYRAMEHQVLVAEENEKRRLGRDLHDSICQHLAGIRMLIETISRRLEKNDPNEAGRLNEVTTYLIEAIETARALSHGLAPLKLDGSRLSGALAEYAGFLEKMFQVRCDIESNCPEWPLNEEINIHLFRIAQEAVQNAVRHGNCRTVRIGLEKENGSMVLSISDDGGGFQQGQVEQGSGMQHMLFRARAIGGELRVESQPDSGTRVTCRFPIGERRSRH